MAQAVIRFGAVLLLAGCATTMQAIPDETETPASQGPQPDPALPSTRQAPQNPPPPPEAAMEGTLTVGDDAFPVAYILPEGWLLLEKENQLLGDKWQVGILNPELPAFIQMRYFEQNAPAKQAIGHAHAGVCSQPGTECSDPAATSDGQGVLFMFKSVKLHGLIAIRDLGGPGSQQVEMFGQWPPAARAAGRAFGFVLGSMIHKSQVKDAPSDK